MTLSDKLKALPRDKPGSENVAQCQKAILDGLIELAERVEKIDSGNRAEELLINEHI